MDKKIYLKDVNGVTHDKCPRCKSNWKIVSNPNYFTCKKDCGLMACLNSEVVGDYFLTADLKSKSNTYTIFWHNSGCIVSKNPDETYVDETDTIHEGDTSIQLPSLPFNITVDKLMTYLIFS